MGKFSFAKEVLRIAGLLMSYPSKQTDYMMNSGRGKISAQPHTSLCIQFLDRENNDKNNRLPLGKQICFTIVWGCAEILPRLL